MIYHRLLRLCLACAGLAGAASWVHAQGPESDRTLDELVARLEEAEGQLFQLRGRLHRLETPGVEGPQMQAAGDQDWLVVGDRPGEMQAQHWVVASDGNAVDGPTEADPQPNQRPAFAPDIVQRGQQAFDSACTQCHDAARALEKTKSLAAWRATVARMATKDGADVPTADIEPIAVYLASLSAPDAQSDGATAMSGMSSAQTDAASGVSFFATVSPLWRGAERRDTVENRGFFPELWVGAEWRPDSPLSARVTACVTCHRGTEPGGHVEIVEGVVRFDVARWLDCRRGGPETAIEAGRFIVPFGAAAAQSHPGALRTATRPLMFNMGQNVARADIGPAILPMPYADEGVVLKRSVPLVGDWNTTLDAYLVNGLQGSTTGVNFFSSRDYSDNNAEPAAGGRVTVGNRLVRLGGSVMAGKFNDDAFTPPLNQALNYEIFGADLTVRFEDRFRLQAEYAMRTSDRLLFGAATRREDEEIEGFSVESELRVWRNPRIGLVARYDLTDHQGDAPPPGSSLGARFNVYRWTWGFNFALPGGSMLILNHEHWELPNALRPVDVVAARWVATF